MHILLFSFDLLTNSYFAFLSNESSLDMRNIPKNQEYLALLIDFEYSDFNGLQKELSTREDIIMGEVSSALEKTLSQFIEWSHIAPKEIWSLRKQEILHLLMRVWLILLRIIRRQQTLH